VKDELKMSPVLAMYDVRGIQRYIFSTNRVRDIIGASNLVENILQNGLDAASAFMKEKEQGGQYLVNWTEDDPEAFLKDDATQMQVLFIGGGNAYVAFRSGAICAEVNRFLGKYILSYTYSLNLAVAVVENTGDYKKDYSALHARMREIKALMPETKPTGAFPFMEVDSVTGYPLAKYDKGAQEYVSTEAYLKRKHLRSDSETKVLDEMVSQKGDNSVLAVVHIDGNGMGNRIREIMQEKTSYPEAVRAMREISKRLKTEFEDCYRKMCEAVDEMSDTIRPDSKGRLYRRIIVAGDDITFVCNAKVAVYAVEAFLNCVNDKVMYLEKGLSEAENKRKYGLSACAGIAFFHSHFPFSVAYEVAEHCCSSAKRVAKLPENRNKDGMIGSYVDYQLCYHVTATDLNIYREKHYRMPDGEMMTKRPYFVGGAGCNEGADRAEKLETLWKNLSVFKNEDGGRSRYKKLRNVFSFGMQEVDKEIVFLESRAVRLPDTDKYSWYDALEIMDICESGGAKS